MSDPGGGKKDREAAPLTKRALDLNMPSVRLDKGFDYTQPQPRPFSLGF
jgi:hypothetical protein